MNRNTIAKQTAYCGMAAALGVTLLLVSGLIPVFTYAAPLFVSLLLLYILKKFGTKAALLTYLVTSVLVLMLGADREAAFFYVFFGHYPVIRPLFSRIPSRPVKFILKIVFFSLLTAAMYYILIKLTGTEEAVSGQMWMNLLFYVLLISVMMLYDRFLASAQNFRFFRHIDKG